MVPKRIGSIAAFTMASCLVLSSCATENPGAGVSGDPILSGTLVGVGASAQGSAQEAWVAGFQTANVHANINYSPDGSGAGRDAFRGGATQFAGSDRAFNDREIAEDAFGSCVPGTGLIELPVYISPIAIAFNLDGIDSLNMDADTIARIFVGDITRWDDDAIASQNGGVALPSTPIEPIYRADTSGTTENVADYFASAAPAVWTFGAVDNWPVRVGTAASQTSGVADALKNTGTIGYIDASRSAGLGTVALKVGEDFVPYSAEAAAALVDASPLVAGRGAFDFAVDLDRETTQAGTYPLVLISYVIACVEYRNKHIIDLVKGYLSYVVSVAGQDAAASHAGSAPISADFRSKAIEAITAIK
ncbi:MAG: phosphate ABC transporter substrate-binding protein PstS [Cryobacterium sp.]|nr:phosphate ABC transporter substrate-binding protein PstS [Cryobacterium sp.]